MEAKVRAATTHPSIVSFAPERKWVTNFFYAITSLSLSLPPRPSHPYTLSCPTSQRNPHNDRPLTSACRPIDLLPLSLTTLLTRRIIRINSRFEEERKSRRRSLKERKKHFLDSYSLFRAMYLKKRGTFLVSRQRNSVFFEFKMNCILR